MSTPKISFKVPQEGDASASTEGVQGDVAVHDLSTAPGKDREREPLFGGEVANISQEGQAMDVDAPAGGERKLVGR